MRIIKEGIIEMKEILESCTGCNTEFAYNASDIKPDRDGAYVNCPRCNRFISARRPLTLPSINLSDLNKGSL